MKRSRDEADHFQIVLRLSSGDILSTPLFVFMSRCFKKCLCRRVGKVVEKGVLSHVVSVGPSVHIKQRDYQLTNNRSFVLGIFILKYVDTFEFSFKPDRNNREFKFHIRFGEWFLQ